MSELQTGDRDEELWARLDAVVRYLQDSFPERRVLGPVRDAGPGLYRVTLPGHPPYAVSVSEEFL